MMMVARRTILAMTLMIFRGSRTVINLWTARIGEVGAGGHTTHIRTHDAGAQPD